MTREILGYLLALYRLGHPIDVMNDIFSSCEYDPSSTSSPFRRGSNAIIILTFNPQLEISQVVTPSSQTAYHPRPPPVEYVEQDRREAEVPVARQASHEDHVGMFLVRGEGHVEGNVPTSQDVPVPSYLVLEVQDVAALRHSPFHGSISGEVRAFLCSSRMVWGRDSR